MIPMNTSWRMWNFLRFQRYIVALLFLSFFLGMILGVALITNVDLGGNLLLGRSHRGDANDKKQSPGMLLKKLRPQREGEEKDAGHQEVEPEDVVLELPEEVAAVEDNIPEPNYDVHIFYYPWYGSPEVDGTYLHWNHPYLPHWDDKETKKWPVGRHVPPDDIGANFYPALGPYSSRDPAVIENHMKQIRSAGIGTLAVSWYPPGPADEQGKPWDDLIPDLLDAAHKYKLKVCLHIEPYKDRTHVTMRKNIEHIMQHYGSHPALYRRDVNGKSLPLYYIYDSYLVSAQDWAQLFKSGGAFSVRGTDLDGIFVGLMVESKHKSQITLAGFDGFYTYFASDGFTYGSNTRSWVSLASFAKVNDLLFIPSIGPGYIDEQVRPWNGRNTKRREGGGYYEQSFKAALLVKPDVISITSFNEWHEGTQIEEAVPKQTKDMKYLDYLPGGPDYYLKITKEWVEKFRKK